MFTFDFAFDGKVDLMSVNPLEMTNFEAGAAIFGIAGVLLTFLLDRYAKNRARQLPHEFVATETSEDAIG